ncbi:MAG: hypothetical protein ABR498_10030 [Candidatus Dormibacteria bacterium]
MSRRSRRSLALAASLGGAADTALFLARRPQLFRQAPGRALGSVGFLAGWAALATGAARTSTGGGTLRALAGVVLAGNAAMLGVHLRHRVAGPRVFVGTALAAVALAATATT